MTRTSSCTSSGHSSPTFPYETCPSLHWSTVDHRGLRLSLPKSLITLTIPEGALNCATKQDIFIGVLPNLTGLSSNPGATPITPAVQCGPGHLTRNLKKSMVLSLPHNCAKPLKKLTLYYSREIVEPDWKEAKDADVQIDSTLVHAIIDKFGAFILCAGLTDLNCISPISLSSSSGCSSISSPHFLSSSTKTGLCRTLDTPSCEGNSWRQLGQLIGINSQEEAFISTQRSPSEALLEMWELRGFPTPIQGASDNNGPIGKLTTMLKKIRREDAIIILQRDNVLK